MDQLLTLGEAPARQHPWSDYVAMGFTAEHVPELIRMVNDEELAVADSDSAEVWGGLHAWRTLGQLRAEGAIGTLVALLEGDDSDWVHNELPRVLGMIGPAALEPLRAALSAHSMDEEPWTAAAAADGIVEIAKRFPEARDPVLDALMRQLRWWQRQDPELNGFLVSDLVELKAVEAAPLMEEVFAADAAEIGIRGDWEDVQVELGLLPARITPRPQYFVWRRDLHPTPDLRIPAARSSADDAKKRRKAEKAARRKNRKRR
ncbi:MAG TPA: hypothetical protein VF092_14500 [Longimicrobium sp.]